MVAAALWIGALPAPRFSRLDAERERGGGEIP
jgi:hypothetical protein